MPGRTYTANSEYRYGFNGKENDKDISEGGQDYGMRISDTRLGRFLSVDPITAQYPELTPYQFASNTPIVAIDLDGLEAYIPHFGDKGDNQVDRANHRRGISIDNKEYENGVGKAFAVTGAIAIDVLATKGRLSTFLMTQHFFGTLHHNSPKDEAQSKEWNEDFKGAASQVVLGWSIVKIVGGVVSAVRSGIPQGLTANEFRVASQRIYNEVKDLSDDIIVQGSRAAGTAKNGSDIDFAIRVNSKEFDELIVKSFGNPKEGSAKWKTMQHAIKTGKIQSGEAGLRPLRKNLEKLLGKEVDISVIKKGGEFDNGVFIPVKNPDVIR